jgi:type II secretion system protein N
MSGNGFFGVEAEGIRFIELAVPVEAEDGAPAPQELNIDEVSVSVSALSYIFGTISIDFDAVLGGGEISGSFEQNADAAQIVAEGEGVDISGLTVLSAGIGLPLGGELSGKVDLRLPEGQMKKAEGATELTIANLTAGDGKAKIRNTIALPKLSAGNLVLKAEATDGRLEISQLSADGKDFQLDASGRIRMREPFDKSAVSMDATFKFKDAYTAKSDLTKSIFGSPDSKIPALFDMDPMVRRAKQPDGSYSWQVSGLLAKPSFRPGATKAARGGAGSREP